MKIKIKDIVEPHFHDRQSYDKEGIAVLANSIKNNGLINPIIVRKLDEGVYERVAGFRRIEACKLLGMDEIDCIIKDLDDKQSIITMVSENLTRESLDYYDRAYAITYMISNILDISIFKLKSLCVKEMNKITNEEESLLCIEVSKVLNQYVNMDITSFYKLIRILEISPNILQSLRNKTITNTTAISLDALKDEELQNEFISYFEKNPLSGNKQTRYILKYLSSNKDFIPYDKFYKELRKKWNNGKLVEEQKQRIKKHFEQINDILLSPKY